MSKSSHLFSSTLLSVALVSMSGFAAQVDEAPIGEAAERHLSTDAPLMQWVQDPDRVHAEEGDRLEVREKVTDELETIKISGLVAPIYFESGVANIPATTVQSLSDIFDRMKHRRNVRLHLVGHADNERLSPRLARIYGDNFGLSRERAGEVAEYFQTALSLPPESVSYDWKGDTQPVASNATEAGRALNRRVEVEVWYDELKERAALEEFLVPHEIKRVKVCRMETVCKLRYVAGHSKRARIQNLIAPLRYDDESIDVPPEFINRVRQALDNLSNKKNVVVKFVGFTDDAALTGRMERIYGTHIGLSKARARRAALAIQDALDLPTRAIDSDGRGSARPLGSNATALGRALNRRVEVEFWYDDPLQDLPDEPQLCPESAGAELMTKVYDPPWGRLENIEFRDGRPVIPALFVDHLQRALADLADKTNVRVRFVGYTHNERLSRRTAAVYGDDIGLSASRARRAMELIGKKMRLEDSELEFEGHGYVQSDDVVNSGFTQEGTSHVAVEVIYDELAVLDDYEGVDITRITREVSPQNPLGLNLMRITVDGVPIDDPKRSSADIQRCTDVAMENVDIQFGFDNLRSSPRLSVAARPSHIAVQRQHADEKARVEPVYFRMYTNYSHFIERAEVRVFRHGQSLESEPLDIVAIEEDAVAKWQPAAALFRAPAQELDYVLRAYGADGNFDETQTQQLWFVYDEVVDDGSAGEPAADEPDPRLLTTYGEDALRVHNIALSSGTVNVRGSGVPSGHEVWVAGRPVPIDQKGNFVSEEILPEGAHTVEVALIDKEGRGDLYLRDLEFDKNDWFYVGMADLTLSGNTTSGPIGLLEGANSSLDRDSNADARLAFLVNGKFGDHWRLTASADTGEGSLKGIFSNFMDKSPDAIFRRIDPDYRYPTFGDDATVEQATPTMGKLFLRLGQGENYGQWGNFTVGYMNNELAQVDRGLYGANVHYESASTTEFGERRLVVDAFGAEPGTLASREEFRGTGGSLYFLQRQDVVAGSERVRIEIRDKASGIVSDVVNLTPAVDYDIDYLQGRILLAEPLASTADDNLLVRTNALADDEVYLVVRYEYSPGLDEIDALSAGGQLHYWFRDYVKVGLTSNLGEEEGENTSLHAADLTLRLAAKSWLKLQHAQSAGMVSMPSFSKDGGFEFDGYDPSAFLDADAQANRVDLSLSSNDLIGFGDSQLTLYLQDVEAGYSAPGLATPEDTQTYGGTFRVRVADRLSLDAKVDHRTQDESLETRTQEIKLDYQLGYHWDVQAGFRRDRRRDRSPLVVLTQETGTRSDAVVQVGYDSKADWNSYLFLQETVAASGERDDNARAGVGGSYRMSDRVRLDAEASFGDLGAAGRIGTNYQQSDNTSVYLNYALENERTDNVSRSTRAGVGNLIAGVKSRLGDSTSVFLEEHYRHAGAMTGLTHATGVSFTPREKWNFGVNTDIGTLVDSETGAETKRLAGGVQAGLNLGDLQVSSAIEFRRDDAEQLDQSRDKRTTWLFRNNFKYQVNPSGRLLGKLNHSMSDSTLGTFYEGGFTEGVLGYAYRPVAHDRLNALVKYTYFYNVPTTDQISAQDIAAEFIQRTHIAAFDVSYDLTPRLSIGGKYGYRSSQVSLDREKTEFFGNNANLFVVRGDYDFRDNWEVLVEARMLDMRDLKERRSGALVTLSRYFGDNLKVGVGYNFTDFSDDLTDLSYDDHGLFLNLTGSM